MHENQGTPGNSGRRGLKFGLHCIGNDRELSGAIVDIIIEIKFFYLYDCSPLLPIQWEQPSFVDETNVETQI